MSVGHYSEALPELETGVDEETQVGRNKKKLNLDSARELSESATWLPLAKSVIHYNKKHRVTAADCKSASQLRPGQSQYSK